MKNKGRSRVVISSRTRGRRLRKIIRRVACARSGSGWPEVSRTLDLWLPSSASPPALAFIYIRAREISVNHGPRLFSSRPLLSLRGQLPLGRWGSVGNYFFFFGGICFAWACVPCFMRGRSVLLSVISMEHCFFLYAWRLWVSLLCLVMQRSISITIQYAIVYKKKYSYGKILSNQFKKRWITIEIVCGSIVILFC